MIEAFFIEPLYAYQELERQGKAILKEEAGIQKLFDTAVKAEAKGEYDSAIGLYRQLIQQHPSSELVKDSRICIEALEKRRA
jgi:outer membrane protein assembly factor BamD (BamD/ComL family)